MSLNRASVLGRLGNDPELKYLPNGTAVCHMSIATSEKWTDKQGQSQEKTEWHRVVFFGPQAENCTKFLSKGSLVLVEGKITTRSWESDKFKDTTGKNVTMYATEIVGNYIQFLSPKKEGSSQPPHQGQNTQQGSTNSRSNSTFMESSDSAFTSDDIPF